MPLDVATEPLATEQSATDAVSPWWTPIVTLSIQGLLLQPERVPLLQLSAAVQLRLGCHPTLLCLPHPCSPSPMHFVATLLLRSALNVHLRLLWTICQLALQCPAMKRSPRWRRAKPFTLDLSKTFCHLLVDRARMQGKHVVPCSQGALINLVLRQCRNSQNTEVPPSASQQSNSATTTTTTGTTTAPLSPVTPTPTSKPIAATLVGTLRRKNPFNRTPINTTDFAISSTSMKEPASPTVPPKSTLRPTSHILQRNKVDPSDEDPEEESITTMEQQKENRKSSKSATLSAKRLSLRIPNAFRNDSTINASSTKKFGFTLGSNSRKQRKQLDLSLFQTEQQAQQKEAVGSAMASSKKTLVNDSSLLPPPALSDGSTLSSSSSTCSSTHSGYYQASTSPVQKVPPTFKSVMHKQSNSNVYAAGNPRRSSQLSFKSIDRRGSNISTSTLAQQQQHINNNRPTTPSLLSNSSTIASPTSTPSSKNNSIPSQPAKASWLNNLFFFKQPKVCSLVVYSTHTAGILRSLHRLMNKV